MEEEEWKKHFVLGQLVYLSTHKCIYGNPVRDSFTLILTLNKTTNARCYNSNVGGKTAETFFYENF